MTNAIAIASFYTMHLPSNKNWNIWRIINTGCRDTFVATVDTEAPFAPAKMIKSFGLTQSEAELKAFFLNS